MLRKQRTAPRSHRRAKPGRMRELRFPLSASIRVSERIGEMHDLAINNMLQQSPT